jgi:hypothetical protein
VSYLSEAGIRLAKRQRQEQLTFDVLRQHFKVILVYFFGSVLICLPDCLKELQQRQAIAQKYIA